MGRLSSRSRLFALGIAVLLLAYGVYDGGPQTFASAGKSLLATASVSISAAIPETPENTIAAQLAAKEARLARQEAALAQRAEPRDIFGVASFVMSMILFLLVGANFYLDLHRRYGGIIPAAYAVDLRRR